MKNWPDPMNPTQELTQVEKNSLIAKHCGWQPDPLNRDFSGNVFPQEPPDYFGDLNAMHEAEKTLTREQCDVYEKQLEFIGSFLLDEEPDYPAQSWKFHATAAQRAEAFGKTLGLWP